jgi:hypothetical protein
VLPSIKLDYKLKSMTGEVGYVMAEAYLPPKVRMRQIQTMPQMPPELSFGFGWLVTHRTSANFVRRSDGAVAPRPNPRFI